MLLFSLAPGGMKKPPVRLDRGRHLRGTTSGLRRLTAADSMSGRGIPHRAEAGVHSRAVTCAHVRAYRAFAAQTLFGRRLRDCIQSGLPRASHRPAALWEEDFASTCVPSRLL